MEPVYNEFGQPVGAPLPDWQRAKMPERKRLDGRYVRLEPVDPDRHARALYAAYQEPAEVPIWTYLGVGPFDSEAAYLDYVTKIAVLEDPLHFALVDQDSGKPVGTFSLMRIDPVNGVIEVGFVVYSPLVKRTRLATEAIYLLMKYVFDELGYRRFEWKCDDLNAPSRAAALRYGFTFEGVFRQAIVYHGRTRDTAWFSVIDLEWPALRTGYERWLDADNFDANGQQIKRLSQLFTDHG